MRPSGCLISLILVLSLLSCEDEKSTAGSSLPPDLRMEDVVGCWYWSKQSYCEVLCFDSSMQTIFHTENSSTRRVSEIFGVYGISGYRVATRGLVSSSMNPIQRESIYVSVGYLRNGSELYSLGKDNEVDNRFFKDGHDSAAAVCRDPFSLFAKPANWTLF